MINPSRLPVCPKSKEKPPRSAALMPKTLSEARGGCQEGESFHTFRDARLAREKAKARERQGTRTDLGESSPDVGTAPGKNTSGNFPEVSTGPARDKAAAGTGYSGRTIDKAAAVMEAAGTGAPRGCPDR